MTIKVHKFADIVENQIAICEQREGEGAAVAAVLTNLQPRHDPMLESSWQMDLLIGKGSAARRIKIDLPPLLSMSDPSNSPVFLGEDSKNRSLLYFRNRLFISERSPKSVSERDEVALRVKRATYEEEADLSNLRAEVANWEAAIQFQTSGPRRDPIPEDVKSLVFARDGGCCVRCGSKHDLQFDHIIPVVKGGANSEADIQILCQTCNLRKSDKIAIT
jgi:5-methylcytosine-specific restriction endonuclease McrA